MPEGQSLDILHSTTFDVTQSYLKSSPPNNYVKLISFLIT